MAINKRKILQSAQKHMQKGALDKALKDYMTLLKADPKDVNIRLKVGDIHLKQGNNDAAVAAYEKVAERFMKDGFDAKAVALYKQITRIDPKRVAIYEPLAELYQRLGLTSDAMAALQTAADAHYRSGARTEALDLLRKMASLDPSNTTSRLKVADLLRQEGRQDEAVAEFREVVQELERQGDAEERAKVLVRILEIDPTHRETLEALGRCRLEAGDHAGAEQTALAAIQHHPDDLPCYQLLADVVEAAGRVGAHAGHFRTMAQLLKARGDDGDARTVMQRFVASGGIGGDDTDEPRLETDDGDLAFDAGGVVGDLGIESPEFSDPGFTGEEGLRLGESIEGLSSPPGGADADAELPADASAPSLPPLPELEIEPDAAEPVEEASAGGEPEGPFDVDQALAEAGVYLRYGKHERAVEALRGILAREPEHRGALDKLADAFAAQGDLDNAVRAFERAAARAREEGDFDGVAALRERLAAVDPAAAEALGPAGDAAPSEGPEALVDEPAPEEPEPSAAEADGGDLETLESDDGIEFEIDVDETEAPAEAGPAAEEAEPADSSQTEQTLEQSDGGLEILSGDEDEDEVTDEAPGAPDLELSDGALDFEVEDDASSQPDQTATLDADGDDFELELEDMDESSGAATSGPPREEEGATSSSTTPAQIVEELEEAEFYVQQGMHAEARAIYTRILEVAPSHPQALLRLGEIEAAERAEASGAAAEPAEPVAEAGAAAAPAAEEDDLSVPGEGFEDLDFDDDDDDDTTEGVAARAAGRGVAEVTAPIAERAAAPAADPAPATEGGEFDLAAELSDAFDDEDALGDTGPRAGTTEEEGFEQVFAAFKAGVKKELGEGDYEAHYDLGIAYKEMGLLDDAIGEFRTAVASPAHQLPCLHMMALCALDLGRPPDAVAHLEQALSLPEVPQEQQVALRFDLGRAYATQGDLGRARAAFEAVQAVDPEFRDVGEQLGALAAGAPAPQRQEEEAFESFDDLLADGDAEEDSGTASAEAYESFDDLMEETEPPAEAAPEPEPAPEPPPEPEPAPPAAAQDEEPPPEPEPGPKKKPGGRRRKKISFV